MTITTEQVKELRQRTGAGVLEVKQALETTGGDMDAAGELLREKGLARAAKKATRTANQGHVASYIHGDPGRVGVLVEVNCETDFVARTADFRALVHEVAMQVAATAPVYVTESDIPPDVLEGERAAVLNLVRSEVAESTKPKPPEVMARIVDGKLNKWLDQVVLVRQPYIRDDGMTFGRVLTDAVARIGENIVVRRFVRFELGESEQV